MERGISPMMMLLLFLVVVMGSKASVIKASTRRRRRGHITMPIRMVMILIMHGLCCSFDYFDFFFRNVTMPMVGALSVLTEGWGGFSLLFRRLNILRGGVAVGGVGFGG